MIRSKRQTDGTSVFNTRTARGHLLLLDPARGEEKLRDIIFIPLKIAKRKRYKNAVGEVVHEAIQIAAESDLSTEQ